MGERRRILSSTHLAAPANSDVTFEGFPAVNRAGCTDSFEVFYDRALGESGRSVGAVVLDRAERDLAIVRTWFGEPLRLSHHFSVVLARLPYAAARSAAAPSAAAPSAAAPSAAARSVADGSGAEDPRSEGGVTLYCDVQTAPGLEALQSSFFLAALIADVAAAAVGWEPGAGGALARVLATALYPRRIAGYATAWAWLDSERADVAEVALPPDPTPQAAGFAALFLNYLHHQLGFSWREIAEVPAPTLGALAARLTESGGEVDRFRSLLESHLPPGRRASQQTDNFFPLADEGPSPTPDGSTANPRRRKGRAVCLLTGSSGTLGAYLCEHLADRYEFAAVYRRHRPPQNVHAIEADLALDGEPERVVELTLARFGRIDMVINAAVASTWAPMLDSDALTSSAPTQFLTNVVVPLRVSCAAARLFWRDRKEENRALGRSVVNLSSVSGRNVYPGEGQSVYAATKAAVDQLTGHMSIELASVGVRVNAVAPNSFPSNVSTDRVARAITALDDSDHTGVVVVVDGATDRLIRIGVR